MQRIPVNHRPGLLSEEQLKVIILAAIILGEAFWQRICHRLFTEPNNLAVTLYLEARCSN